MPNLVTLKDIAQHVGVSYQTVSKVLKGQGNVSIETKDKIESAVKELGYKPNVRARNLRMQSSRLIGYSWLLEETKTFNPSLDVFFQELIQGVTKYDYHLLTHAWRDKTLMVEGHRDLIYSGQVDGFVLSTVEYNDPRVAFLMEIGFPFVGFGCANPDWDYPYVDIDFFSGIRLIIDHLVDIGHQAISVIALPDGFRPGDLLLKGFYKAMKIHELPVNPEWIIRGTNQVSSGFEAAERLINNTGGKRPTAIVCLTDILAIGAIAAAKKNKLPIGREFSITGFENAPLLEYFDPSLTTVELLNREAGCLAVDMLVKTLSDNFDFEKHVLFKPRLIIRNSTMEQDNNG